MNFGERLKILREKHSMTQAEVAEYLKTTQSYYAQYERNMRQMTFERAAELAALYDVSLDFLAGFTDDINRRRK